MNLNTMKLLYKKQIKQDFRVNNTLLNILYLLIWVTSNKKT